MGLESTSGKCGAVLHFFAVPRARAAYEIHESVSPQTGTPTSPKSESSTSVSKDSVPQVSYVFREPPLPHLYSVPSRENIKIVS